MQRNITKRLSVWAVVVAGVLMIPFLAKAPWTAGDFVFGAVVLFGLAVAYELITRSMDSPKHRIVVGFGALFVIGLVMAWAATGP